MKLKTLLVVLILASLVLSACSPSPTPTAPVPAANSKYASPEPVLAASPVPATAIPSLVPAAAPEATGGKVRIVHFSFNPSKLEIKAGTTVTWTNEDDFAHTVAAEDGSFTSDTLDQGGSYSFTFSQAGTYAYHCDFHASMKATIIVTP